MFKLRQSADAVLEHDDTNAGTHRIPGCGRGDGVLVHSAHSVAEGIRLDRKAFDQFRTVMELDGTRSVGAAVLAIVLGIFTYQGAHAQVDCSNVFCSSANQQIIDGFHMFDETNFTPVVDGLGRGRRFWVHIPESYDTLAMGQKMPVIFAFHGGSDTQEPRDMMLGGKWADYFNQEIAFVIPRGEPNPCNISPNPEKIWLGPSWGPGVPAGGPLPSNCDPATQHVAPNGAPITYTDASLPSTFTDILFVANLRAIILSRFPNLNPNKTYATGFSSGGGMSYSLLCYRAHLFRGFSVVAKTLFGDQQRGDYNTDGIAQTDRNSLVATCGKSRWDAGHATGILAPQTWGYPTKPVALFVGDQDSNYTLQEINDTGAEIRIRNNLRNLSAIINPFMNGQADDAETEFSRSNSVNNVTQPSSAFEQYLVRRTANPTLRSADHAIPDAQECPPPLGSSFGRMTCDFEWTDRTVSFFKTFADLNLNP